jgi:hypothetical protein
LLTRSKDQHAVAIYEMHETDIGRRYRHAGSSASIPDTLPCIRVDISRPPEGKRHITEAGSATTARNSTSSR